MNTEVKDIFQELDSSGTGAKKHEHQHSGPETGSHQERPLVAPAPEFSGERQQHTASAAETVQAPEIETGAQDFSESTTGEGEAGMGAVSMRPQPTLVQHAPKSERLIRVEKLLEEGMEGIVEQLRPDQQQVVIEEAERTAVEITTLFETAKATALRVFKLIFRWLSFIPGLSKWFIKQEAKIKSDKLIQAFAGEKGIGK